VPGVYDSRRGHQDGTTGYSKHQGQMIMINHDDKVYILVRKVGKNLMDSMELWLRSSSIDSSVFFNVDVYVDVNVDVFF